MSLPFWGECPRARIAAIDWTELHQTDNINIANHIFENKVLSVLDNMMPLKCVQNRKNYINWVTDSTKELMSAKDTARENTRLTKREDDWSDYKNLWNRCNKQVKKDRVEHQEHLYKTFDMETNPKTVFKLTKEILGWSGSKPPVSFQINDRLVNTPQEVANIQLDYFTEKINNLMKWLPTLDLDPLHTLKKVISKWKHKDNIPKLWLKTISEQEVLKQIMTIGNSTA